MLLLGFALLGGTLGHMLLARDITWYDAVLNSAFIATGIGPYISADNIPGKVFFALTLGAGS
ncbi:hypothetical protein [Serratia sp. NPDC087055]|uniref:hypothetical protein n=1 Tax=Serratia sp. NPDC087055 TaxID=3364516 RepID=UPI00384C9F2B